SKNNKLNKKRIMTKSSILVALLCICFILLSPTEMRLTLNAGLKLAEAKICEKYSQTWSGRCTKTSHCDRQCINWEDARHGACHQDKHGRACFCYFNCKK
ncbi:hypothetical protein HID58_073064, partial [Brassica napus]